LIHAEWRGRGKPANDTVPDAEKKLTASDHSKTRSPGLVWAIPWRLYAIVATFGSTLLLNRGEVVSRDISQRAAGAEPGRQGLYQGVEAGQLPTRSCPTGMGVVLDFPQLSLAGSPKLDLHPMHNRAHWSVADVFRLKFAQSSSLRGSRLSTAPGMAATPQTRFEGLEEKRQSLAPGMRGRLLLNTGDQLRR